jgi:hypothetical protein
VGGKSRSNSGDSESAVRPSLPASRSSSINNGMSAPNSSQGARSGAQLSSLRATVSGGGLNGGLAPSAYKGSSQPSTGGTANSAFEYGHDFFSGHWAESRAFVGSYDASLEDSSKANTGRETNPDEQGIFFLDSGNAMSATGTRPAPQPPRKGIDCNCCTYYAGPLNRLLSKC